MASKWSRRKRIALMAGIAVVVLAVDMWLESEPEWPLAVWHVVDPIHNLLISPVSLCSRFGDVSRYWFELHAASAMLWGAAIGWLVTRGWKPNRAEP